MTRTFLTWGQWLSYVTADSELREAQRHSRTGDEHFTSTASWDDALKLARQGWPEGAKLTRNFAAALTTKIVGRVEREDVVYDVEGAGFDVARLLGGTPEHWQRWEPAGERDDARANRCIAVLMNGSASWNVPARTIIARGAACCALVELLEFAGARVQLDVVWTVTPGWGGGGAGGDVPPSLDYRVTVKRYAQPLDAGAVAFAAAHPSALRRLVFSAKEREPAATRLAYGVPDGGYGQPAEVPEAERDGALYVPAASSAEGRDWGEANASERWVIEMLREQGVVLRDA